MSKFINKLKNTHKAAAPAMGFGKPSEKSETSPLLLVADLTGANLKKSKEMAGIDIDAALLKSDNLDISSYKKITTSLGDKPIGLICESIIKEDLSAFTDAGLDFLIFGLQSPVELVSAKKLGKILKIETSLTPNLVRAINELDLPIDGVFIATDEPAITVKQLLIQKSFCDLLNKPVLVNINSMLTTDELSSLYATGIKGFILPLSISRDAIAAMRGNISMLPQTIKQKGRDTALLPHISIDTKQEIEEDEVEVEEDI